MMERVRPYSRYVVFILKMSLFAMLFFTFFLIMGYTNPQILRLSRTSGITVTTFIVLGLVLMSVYGGYDIGKYKSKSIIYSMSLATLITDAVTYFQLMIMNVNETNNPQLEAAGADILQLIPQLELLGTNLLLLLIIIALQVLIIIGMTYLGNHIFFKLNPPEKCMVITSSFDSCDRVARKIDRFRLQYKILHVADYRAKDLYAKILKCDTVFLYEVPIGERREIVEFCYKNYRNVHYQMDILDVIESSSDQTFLDDMLVSSYTKPELTMEQRFIKRAMDIVISALMLLITSPIVLLSALAILVFDGRPVFFKQERLTRGGRRFKIIKLRTMKIDPEEQKHISYHEDDRRITRTGRFLRRSRFDELPQLINVLKGEMSLVGPRPEMLENIDLYTRELPEFTYRLKVKAGLTGYAQISGRYNTAPKDKLIMDLMYIENYSLWLDIKLLFKTPIVFFRSDSTEGFSDKKDPMDLFEWNEYKEPRHQKHRAWWSDAL